MNYYLNSDFVFENFIVGSGNEFAFTVCRDVASKLGVLYNPLIICGRIGCGKTHLMHAIGNYCMTQNNNLKIKATTSEFFVHEFITAIRNSCLDKFRASFANIDLMLMDSIEFIANKVQSPEEFLHIYDSLMHEGRTQIICTSDKEPALLNFNEALTSRLSSGLTVRVNEPDRKSKVDILMHYARKNEFGLNPDAAALLAEEASTPRELEGLLIQIKAYVEFHARHITLDYVQYVLSKTKGV